MAREFPRHQLLSRSRISRFLHDHRAWIRLRGGGRRHNTEGTKGSWARRSRESLPPKRNPAAVERIVARRCGWPAARGAHPFPAEGVPQVRRIAESAYETAIPLGDDFAADSLRGTRARSAKRRNRASRPGRSSAGESESRTPPCRRRRPHREERDGPPKERPRARMPARGG